MEQQVLRHVDGRWEPVKGLYHLLVHEGFTGSYRAVLRYVSRRRPVTWQRPVRRVETAPGAQVQVDWVTPAVCVEALGMHAFIMTLSHSCPGGAGGDLEPESGTVVMVVTNSRSFAWAG